jgi:hypothetical protein
MSSNGSFEITGLTEFENDLLRVIGKKFPSEAKIFIRKQANEVRKLARAWTPKDTGYTRKSWKVFTKGKKTVTANFAEAKVTNYAELSHLLENGHVIKNQYGEYGFQPGVHMLEYAVIQREAVFDNELQDFIRRTLEDVAI